MIISKVLGGMGNQMFQYAMAFALAKRSKQEFKIDNSSLLSHGERTFDLNHFHISAELASLRDFSKLGMSFLSYPLIKLKKHPKYYLEKDFSFNQNIFDNKSPIYLNGYFQSDKYFLDFENDIRKELTFKTDLNDIEKKFLEIIHSTTAISVHVRRGDYVQNPILAPLPLNYYEKSINKMLEHISNPTFFVFSDDLQWVKENLKIRHPVIYVEGNTGKNSFRDMRLMRFCQHHIIANSSFSWWGAWLNPEPNKIVFAPKEWFIDKVINDKDLIPSTWIKIN
ncbi:MAG: alpha-1,2-fucosyltransferase [Bacteriovoracaceae bacterium]